MDYYAILEVSRNSTDEEIKKSYRRLAKLWHPDKNPEKAEEASIQFKKITAAFEILSDQNKRFEYNQKGYVGRRPPSPPKPAPVQKPQQAPKPPPPPPPEKKPDKPSWEWANNSPKNTDPTTVELESVNCSFFGGYPNGQGRSIMTHVFLTEEEMKTGCTKFVTIKRREMCDSFGGCGGIGDYYVYCQTCKGKGQIFNGNIYLGECPTCMGEKNWHELCHHCNGVGLKKWVLEQIKVVVPPHAVTGQQLMIRGVGEPAHQKDPGNLRVVILPLVKK